MTPKPTIDLTLRLASCLLSLQGLRRGASFAGSNATDAVAEAVHACVELVRGRRDVSFVWRAEPDGVFVDIHIGTRFAQLVVHDMRDPDWPFDDWQPERGPVLFRLTVESARFMREFAQAATSLPAQIVAGRPRPVWGLPLPDEEIAEITRWLEQQADNTPDGGPNDGEEQS